MNLQIETTEYGELHVSGILADMHDHELPFKIVIRRANVDVVIDEKTVVVDFFMEKANLLLYRPDQDDNDLPIVLATLYEMPK